MFTVYKYPFYIEDEIVLEMPAGAKVIHVDTQDGQPCMWARVDTKSPLETRKFLLVGTGHPIEGNPWRHVGTFQMPPFVWHLFED